MGVKNCYLYGGLVGGGFPMVDLGSQGGIWLLRGLPTSFLNVVFFEVSFMFWFRCFSWSFWLNRRRWLKCRWWSCLGFTCRRLSCRSGLLFSKTQAQKRQRNESRNFFALDHFRFMKYFFVKKWKTFFKWRLLFRAPAIARITWPRKKFQFPFYLRSTKKLCCVRVRQWEWEYCVCLR